MTKRFTSACVLSVQREPNRSRVGTARSIRGETRMKEKRCFDDAPPFLKTNGAPYTWYGAPPLELPYPIPLFIAFPSLVADT
jgi:hypothetical protein